jgi:hypothetical protein
VLRGERLCRGPPGPAEHEVVQDVHGVAAVLAGGVDVACDELDGIPKSQVSKFQVIPPARPAATTVSVTSLVSTRPLAIVAATASDRNAPTRFSTPEMPTATFGLSALVAMEVAIALPVS